MTSLKNNIAKGMNALPPGSKVTGLPLCYTPLTKDKVVVAEEIGWLWKCYGFEHNGLKKCQLVSVL